MAVISTVDQVSLIWTQSSIVNLMGTLGADHAGLQAQ